MAELRHAKKHQEFYDACTRLTERSKYAELILEIDGLMGQNAALEAEVEQWKTWGIIEIAVRNLNVASYMEEWESRAIKAEAEIERLKAPVRSVDAMRMLQESRIRGLQTILTEWLAARASAPATGAEQKERV
jgi:hypothetical protein